MKENPVIANLRPWCVGRLVFDRPAESRVYSERYGYAGSAIEFKPDVSLQGFQRLMEVRERELRAQKRTRLIPYREKIEKGLKSIFVETEIPLLQLMASPSPTSRIFVHKKDAHRVDAAYEQEGYIHVGTNLLTLKTLVGAEEERILRRDTAWYRETTPRDDWTVPTGRGFCVKGALIGGAPVSTESLTQASTLPSDGPAALIIKMRSSLDIDQQVSLVKSLPDLRRRLEGGGLFGKVRILRSGKRQFAGMEAEEVLLATRESGVELFRFYLIAPGVEGDRARPYTEVQMQLGSKPRDDFPPAQATSAVDEAGALQAWDILLGSFRLRPGAL
ncbi:T6SS immunity protein Tli4 family protein [Cupriavidus agavae]|uniref:Tle cognate immunity protein 4 C-terminal domain-containing protein n=1 Tax=Cupriavidus agavae TaxID=1001822 RepID=A0A4Q7RS33_9BURK|nr:T6SS immunity protein Tli4 family protein [Cupriavidus agavae]RZT36424.1 hypothetical protein EV147_3744 [Cupriavidus agavae]